MSPTDLLLIVLAVGYIMFRRMSGQLVEVKSLFIVPVVLTVIGANALTDITVVTPASIGFVVLGVGISLVLGLIRGTTVHLGERAGELWMRYRWATVGLWVLNVIAKVALIPVEHGISSAAAIAADNSIMVAIGAGMLAESVVVAYRAMRTDSVVVWSKGSEGEPHRSSAAFDNLRAAVRQGRVRSVVRDSRDW